MRIEWKTAARWAGFGVATLLVACDGGAGSSGSGQSEPPEEASPAGPDEHTTGEGSDTSEGTDPAPSGQQTVTLVRRAELREVDTVVSPTLDPSSALSQPCGTPSRVAGQLDADSHFVTNGPFGWLVDAYVVTALETGTVSIGSHVEPLGDAYVYGYGFPLNAQRVEPGESLPTLSASLIPGMSLPDDALNDGKARMDLPVEAGVQYVVLFKALVGSASQGKGWRYALGTCGDKLRIDGKLWVSADENDMVPSRPLSGLLSRDNADPGAMGALAQTLGR